MEIDVNESRPLLNDLAIIISTKANNIIEHTNRKLNLIWEPPKLAILPKVSEELSEIIIKWINLNERLEQEVNSLAIENDHIIIATNF